MAINSQGRWGPAVAAAVSAWSAANVPQNRTTFVTDGELVELWKVITGQHQSELNNHQDIVLQAADIKVDPGSFKDSLLQPITGVGISEAVTLQQRTA